MKSNNTQNELLTTGELAERMNLHPSFFRRMKRSGFRTNHGRATVAGVLDWLYANTEPFAGQSISS